LIARHYYHKQLLLKQNTKNQQRPEFQTKSHKRLNRLLDRDPLVDHLDEYPNPLLPKKELLEVKIPIQNIHHT
jgi:hypothetical protein